MNRYAEKRQHIRIPLSFVTVEIYNDLKRDITSSETYSIEDISESGMKFLSKEHYEIHRPLRLTFILPGSTIPILANSTVVYQHPQNALLSTGVQFVSIGLIEFTILKTYIETLLRRN
jgi:hypothetical protein